MDIIWLKRDVRLHDHGPFAEASKSNNPLLILYLYEPDQLAEPTVHGSHLLFVQEGLVDLEHRLLSGSSSTSASSSHTSNFECITICHATAVDTFEYIHHQRHSIHRILAHQETGHWQSFMRDKAVRKWCRSNSIPFIEYNQTGVTRCLRNRDDYSKHFKAFINNKPRHQTPTDMTQLRKRLVRLKEEDLPGYMPNKKLDFGLLRDEIPGEHRVDRPQRQQKGGTTQALATLNSFLETRGCNFSRGISSPNTSWTSCSRLSPYLTWGHVSLRYVIHALQKKQESLRELKKKNTKHIGSSRSSSSGQQDTTTTWLKSLQAFSSRLHWRSHFIQKLESEPIMEKQDLCRAYQPLRRQDGDWNESHYIAWSTGKTGFPFVDACMRCLLQHGWINFRMRAMLVSFATYNLWLDWKRLAPHLARVFLDYEPGIHYPQLQMQAGTTGINAMRVYNVTKQGKDQDPHGVFIKRYVPELKDVPIKYIHEPWKIPPEMQRDYQVVLGVKYPLPIVQEQESAKLAKDKMAAVKNKSETKSLAQKVYQKHGSRDPRREQMNGRRPKALSSTNTTVKREDPSKQPKISSIFAAASKSTPPTPQKYTAANACRQNITGNKQQAMLLSDNDDAAKTPATTNLTKQKPAPAYSIKRHLTANNDSAKRQKVTTGDSNSNGISNGSWSCKACTFLNDNPLGLACSICATPRSN